MINDPKTMRNIKSYVQMLSEGDRFFILGPSSYKGPVNQPWTKWAGTSFAGRDLSGANFYHASFYHCDLSGCDLRDSMLERAEFPLTTLRGANLSGSQMWAATLYQTDLTDANLENVEGLEGIRSLSDAKFLRTNLKGVSRKFFERVFKDIEKPLEFLEDCYGIPEDLVTNWKRIKKVGNIFGK